MESILNVLNNVEDFKKNYLDYQTGYEKETNRNLHRRLFIAETGDDLLPKRPRESA